MPRIWSLSSVLRTCGRGSVGSLRLSVLRLGLGILGLRSGSVLGLGLGVLRLGLLLALRPPAWGSLELESRVFSPLSVALSVVKCDFRSFGRDQISVIVIQ